MEEQQLVGQSLQVDFTGAQAQGPPPLEATVGHGQQHQCAAAELVQGEDRVACTSKSFH